MPKIFKILISFFLPIEKNNNPNNNKRGKKNVILKGIINYGGIWYLYLTMAPL